MVKKIIKKKTYNAFKMWGSYVGVLYVLIKIFLDRGDLLSLDFYPLLIILLGISTSLIMGFIFGWGLHSLARFWKK